jgi:hypothetical protein
VHLYIDNHATWYKQKLHSLISSLVRIIENQGSAIFASLRQLLFVECFKTTLVRAEALPGDAHCAIACSPQDFTTASREALTSQLLHARDDALARKPYGPEFVITGTHLR